MAEIQNVDNTDAGEAVDQQNRSRGWWARKVVQRLGKSLAVSHEARRDLSYDLVIVLTLNQVS